MPLLAGLLSLGGCGLMHRGQGHEQWMGERLHREPLVFVKAGLVSVSPEPVVLQTGPAGAASTPPVITWRLPEGTRFDGAGIVVLGRLVDAKGEPVPATQKGLEAQGTRIDERARDAFTCQVGADQRSATCRPNAKPGARGIYKYQIRVVHQGQLITWDPNILHLD
ncbi:MAG: hypothetical protein U1F56_07640 [Rubrivivax sp.]